MKHLLLALAVLATPVGADPVQITDIRAALSGDGWRFDVTLLHPDTGWDHYADAWRVEDADGNVLGERILLHPHVNEQPFTRSQTGIGIPEGMAQVFVRARCTVDGWNSDTTAFDLN